MKRRDLYILITIVITSYLLISCSQRSATETQAPARSTEEITAIRAQASTLFEQRDDLDKLREAIKHIGSVRNPEKRDYEIEWTFARYNYFLGRHTTESDEADKAFTQGRAAARIALNVSPNRPEGHFWFGANFGELCKRSPVTVGLRHVAEVRRAMLKVVEMEPGYEGASAFDVLGQIELATRLKDGTAEKAVEYLEKGLEYEKDNPSLNLHLAEAYRTLRRDAEAKQQLMAILQMKPAPGFGPEHAQTTAAAKKLLETKFK
jgi:tetratricopeptide (TPR) repeat protein